MIFYLKIRHYTPQLHISTLDKINSNCCLRAEDSWRTGGIYLTAVVPRREMECEERHSRVFLFFHTPALF